MEAKYIIDQDTLQKVLDYLTTRPFNEVNNLIIQIQRQAVLHEPEQVKATMSSGKPAEDKK